MKNNNAVIINIDGVIIVFTMLLLTVHDYLFNKMLFHTPFYYLAVWKDLLVVLFLSYIFISIYQNSLRAGNISKGKIHYLIFLFVFLLVAMYGLNSGLIGNVSNYRYYFLIVYFSAFYAWLISKNINRNIRYFENGLYLATAISVAYGYYQSFTITKPEDFWYWNHFISLGYEQNIWDAFRDGKPRISSFFTSSLDYSLFLLTSLSFLLCFTYKSILENKQLRTIFNLMFLVIVYHSIYISTVRSALIGSVGVSFVFFSYFVIRSKLSRLLYSAIIFLSLTLLTFGYIALGFTNELSALGRLSQWVSFFEQLKSSPIFGLGIAKIGSKGVYWYDSFWVNYFLSFGVVFGLGFIYFLIKIYVYAVGELSYRKDPTVITFHFPLYMMTPVFFYLFFFQSFSRTSSLYIFISLYFLIYLLKRKTSYIYRCEKPG